MGKRIILALLALLCASYAAPAAAVTCGGFTVPTDIAALPGWVCDTVTPTYKTDSSANTVLDPAVSPPPSIDMTNIAVPSTTNRIITGGPWVDSTSGFCTISVTCTEAKFRTHVDHSHCLPDDPIRNFAAPGTSHLHCFFGNGRTNAYSTYKSLRNRALTSTAAGTDGNGTGYWFGALVSTNTFGDGKNYVIKPNGIILYYVTDPTTGQGATHLPIGLRYVFGFEMDDEWAWLQTVITAANTAYGSARYSLTKPVDGYRYGQAYYVCSGATISSSTDARTDQGPGVAKYIRTPGGADPWGGTCESAKFTASFSGTNMTVTAVASGTLQPGQFVRNAAVTSGTSIVSQTSGTTGGTGVYVVDKSQTVSSTANLWGVHQWYIGVNGSDCYLGRLWSPGGYKNVIPRIWDSLYSKWVCPTNSWNIPPITLEIHFTTNGASDRAKWDLSSDLAKRTATSTTQSTYPAGSTFHTDWMYGWDANIAKIWQEACIGVEHHTSHQCASSIIDSTRYLKGGIVGDTLYGSGGEGGAGGRAPQIDFKFETHDSTADTGGLMLIPPSWTNSISHMCMHGTGVPCP